MFFEEFRFSYLKEGSLKQINRKLLSFKTLREQKDKHLANQVLFNQNVSFTIGKALYI